MPRPKRCPRPCLWRGGDCDLKVVPDSRGLYVVQAVLGLWGAIDCALMGGEGGGRRVDMVPPGSHFLFGSGPWEGGPPLT